jgi:hypothetical protein
MPSSHQHPARLTKKQKKATAFRERGSGKPKGEGEGKGKKGKGSTTMIGKPNPTPGHSRPSTTAAAGDNGYEDDDDEDANAIPVMEDQDQVLAAMAGYPEGDADAKGDDSAQSRRAARVPKNTAMESTSTSTAAQSRRKRGRGSSSRAEELGDSEAQPGPKKKKAKLARSSEETLPAREELDDGSASVNDDGDGDGSKTKSKGSSKPLRYILFIGNVLSPPLLPPTRPLTELGGSRSSKGNLKYTTTLESIQKHFASCGAFSLFSPFLSPSKVGFTDKKRLLRSPTQPRPTPDGTPPHAQGHHTSWRDRRRQVQVQRLRIPRILSATRAAGSTTLTPV